MITQYTRLIIAKLDNSILHCTSQDFPFADGWEPVEFDQVTHDSFDFEMVTDFEDSDYGVGRNQEMLRSRKILENFEVLGVVPKLKAGADVAVSAKVLAVSNRKDITETLVLVEMVQSILLDLPRTQQSEAGMLGELRRADSRVGDTIESLCPVQIIILAKALAKTPPP